ncbi:DNA-directed RNA polymerase [Coemansia sp. RSA 552]|nr:DNA-directed RNA polymerase [Coemansia sp. RSA 552]
MRQHRAEFRHIRQLSQHAARQSAQLAEAPARTDSYSEESLLLSSPHSNILLTRNHKDDIETKHYLQTGKTMGEQLSIMNACLANGNPAQAQRILIGMYRLYPQAMQEIVDAPVHNEMINGFVMAKPRPMLGEALQWFDLMGSEYDVAPNASTFAILIGGYARASNNNIALALMQEMLRCGHTIHNMLLSPYLSDADISRIKTMAQAIMGESPENYEVASMLLSEVQSAEESLEKLVGSSNSSASMGVPDDAHVTMKTIGTMKTKREGLDSTDVDGIKRLQGTLQTLYDSDLQGYNLQIRLENDTYDAALEGFKEINANRNDPLLLAKTDRMKKLAASWLPGLERLIEEEQQRHRVAIERDQISGNRTGVGHGEIFSQLEASKMATVTILETMRALAVQSRSVKEESMPESHRTLEGNMLVGDARTTRLANMLSGAIHNEIKFEQMRKRTNRHIFGHNISLTKMANSGKLFNMAVRRAVKRAANASFDQTYLSSWSPTTKMRIGVLLLSMLIEVARVPEKYEDPQTGVITERPVPALMHGVIMTKGRRVGVVQAHSSLKDLFRESNISDVVSAQHLPMLVPPRPWITYNTGGYLCHDEPCMRMKGSKDQVDLLRKASNENRLETMLMGLDALGTTRWAINKQVFETVRKVWNSGLELASIPPKVFDTPEPVKPVGAEWNSAAMREYNAKKREWVSGRANQHSLRCSCNYKIEIAQAFLNHPMYFPHNIDFRGRAYPMPPHFNHLDNDMCRGLLVFYEGRPLTEKGIYWLKIHLANLFGKDKLSHADRLKFVDENFANITAAADCPLPDAFMAGEAGAVQPWWLEAESPWQALSACIEYTAAMRSSNPAEYVSHLHVHQDGTCNGLQHYAAMGRDRTGAREVNLAPSDAPQDVYTGILHIAEKLVAKDAQAGVTEALALDKRLTRKVVKQTVMTNVYGVTLIGAREQIAARLRDIKDDHGNDVFSIVEVSSLALYLAKKVFDSIGEVFTQAQEIQNWLNEAARRVSSSMPSSALDMWRKAALDSKKSQKDLREALAAAKKIGQELSSKQILELRPDLGPGAAHRKRMEKLLTKPMEPVAWTSPLGLTIVQPYRKSVLRSVSTCLQNITIVDPNVPSSVNPQKQKTAFPPNFVHSLDASHMILSAIQCKKAGLVFASVHDSYWTHACDVDKMNAILRDQFVALHEKPIMENLKAELEYRYGNYKMPVVCWEYSTKYSFKAGVLTERAKRMTLGPVKEKKKKSVDSVLAESHLQSCAEEGDEAAAVVVAGESSEEAREMTQADIERAEASLAASMEVLDLNSVVLIDPKKDPMGAVRQADLIAYTLSSNTTRIKTERSALKKKYRTRINEVRKCFGLTADRPPTKKRPSVEAMEAISAAAGRQITLENAREYLAELEQESDAKGAALDAAFPTQFETSKILLMPLEDPETLMKVQDDINDGKLAGRLSKRIEWSALRFEDLPAQGDFDIQQVRQSRYFFS